MESIPVLAAARAAAARFSRSIGRPAMTGALVLATVLTGCWGDGPVPAQEEDEHEIIFGSTAQRRGQLVTDYDFDEPILVAESAELGGFTVYSGPDPGFVSLERTIEGEEDALFALPEGMSVAIRITAIDAGVQIVFGDAVLAAEGDAAEIGTTPIHVHPQWQLVYPTGDVPPPHFVSFVLTTDVAGYEESASYTAVIGVGEDDHEHEHEDGEHEGEHD